MTSPPPVVELTGISMEFPGVKALQDVDFRLLPGEVHALMGENGAGKSTLIKVLTRVYDRTAGSVRLDGREVARQPGAMGAADIVRWTRAQLEPGPS